MVARAKIIRIIRGILGVIVFTFDGAILIYY